MNHSISLYIRNLETRFKLKFPYNCIDLISSLVDTKVIKLTIPIFFLKVDSNLKPLILKEITKTYNLYLSKDINNSIIKDYRVYALTIMIYLLKNFNNVQNTNEVISVIEEELMNMNSTDNEVVTIDKVISLISQKK